MQIYLVGGAVRDQLLNLPVRERDWVVVGATAEDMVKLGYLAVGKDFPVFLHPDTKEEYALARTERKVAPGYRGFKFHAAPEVTLEQDLQRRDLTVNAIAQDENGKLIDPYGGQADLQAKVLRHISKAFAEDPVRILRLARFAARFTDFSVATETIQLMQTMVAAGEVDALVAERVWKECERALASARPIRFYETLQAAHALQKLFPTQNYEQNCAALEQACTISELPTVRWAAWHANLSADELTQLCQQYRVPKAYRTLAEKVCNYKETYKQLAQDPNSENLLTFLLRIGALRDANSLLQFQQVCQACDPDANTNWDQHVVEIAARVAAIDTSELQNQELVGKAFADALNQQRRQLIADYLTHME